MFHARPEYSNKISLVSAMSPISYTGNIYKMLNIKRVISYHMTEFDILGNTAGMLKWMTQLLVNLPEWMTEIGQMSMIYHLGTNCFRNKLKIVHYLSLCSSLHDSLSRAG